MVIVGGDPFFESLFCWKKLQLLGHVVTEVCNRSLVVLMGKFLLVALACGFYQVFVIIKTSSEKQESEKNRSFSFLATLKYAFWLQKNNLPTTIITSFCRKNIAWKWYATHSKQQHFGTVSKNHRVSTVCFGICLTVQILASKKVDSEVRRLNFIVRCTKVLKKVHWKLLLEDSFRKYPKGSFTFCLWRFFLE